jgi:hypothetical protein
MSCSIPVRFSFTLLLFYLVTNVLAQEVTVHGSFLKDSIRIGETIPYTLTARYPSSKTVLFPDSTFSFVPFEFNSKKYFRTRSTAGESYDSVIYELATFEIDSVQLLRLPIFVVATRDCTVYQTEWDTVFLQQLVTAPPPDTLQPQQLPLKVNTAYEQVPFLFNYPILLIGVGALLLIALIVWILFGKRIRKYYRIRRLNRNHAQFINSFDTHTELLKQNFSPTATEITLFIWKRYLEKLEKKPFTKLTTRETLLLERDEVLANSLREIDKAIYGHDTSVVESLQTLRTIAENRFTKKIETLKHG